MAHEAFLQYPIELQQSNCLVNLPIYYRQSVGYLPFVIRQTSPDRKSAGPDLASPYVLGDLLLLRLGRAPIHLHSCSHYPISNREGVFDVKEGHVEGEEREENPEHVEENKVDPEEHEVASVQVLVHGEPFGSESHETYAIHGQ